MDSYQVILGNSGKQLILLVWAVHEALPATDQPMNLPLSGEIKSVYREMMEGSDGGRRQLKYD